jgi:hypothetical protein
MKYLSIICLMLLTGLCVMAQNPSPSAAFAAPSSAVADWLTAHLVTISTYGSLLLSEVVMRLFPTAKPMSWLYGVSALCKWLASLSSAVAAALDGICQNKSA